MLVRRRKRPLRVRRGSLVILNARPRTSLNRASCSNLLIRAADHRPEFDHLERPAVEPDARLAIDDRRSLGAPQVQGDGQAAAD